VGFGPNPAYPILVVGNVANSNLVKALQGKGPLFDNTGAFPQMPASANPPCLTVRMSVGMVRLRDLDTGLHAGMYQYGRDRIAGPGRQAAGRRGRWQTHSADVTMAM